ncbi:MAG: DsbA family protein [Chloroflexi bacterium]|nr:DsbA family protein [Chloroflexota bacterium]
MEKLKQSHGVTVQWRSFELRPPGSPPMPPEYSARIEAARPRLVAMAREQYDLELNVGPFGIDSRPALIGAKYAEAQGVGEAYHTAVFRAYWQEAQDIGRPDVLADLAAGVGLDRAAFAAALDDAGFLAQMLADVEQAHAYGLGGVPALVYNSKYLVSGAQPYAVLAQVAENVLAE